MTPKEKLTQRLMEIGGCGDGNCQVFVQPGMHTNGGCRCLRHDDLKVQRVLRAWKDYSADLDSEIIVLEAELAELLARYDEQNAGEDL